ncbi:hypothetical protein ILUMI_27462 [Ignelater luminosus]|uniref:DNA oxidative demethylase ALKBH2 n=1 Tax=Ignelater luminosus TaxID=2038154 RepID=A0A8K0C7W4_IGNLU|nr:hypothetical protein ILUMI_27462 [Ignelater luminosus]
MKRMKIDLSSALKELESKDMEWEKTTREGLDVDYAQLLPRNIACELMTQLETNIEYYSGDLTKVKVFGKWHQIPRQQVAYGDEGLKYHFSGVTLPAKPWINPLISIRELISKVTGHNYNFVLINRYRNGSDHIGKHRDDESELDSTAPIASLSLGQHRDFILTHGNRQKKEYENKDLTTVKIMLQHGSLLLMNPPTNKYWYHSLPPRKSAPGVRINLTFRKINIK